MEEGRRKSWSKILWICIAILILALLLIGIIRFGNIFAFLFIVPYIRDALISDLGLNKWLATLAAMVPAGLLIFSIAAMFSWRLPFVDRLKSKEAQAEIAKDLKNRRLYGFIGVIAVTTLSCIFMFIMTKDQIFGSATGKSLKCYSLGFNGYEEVSCDWEFHPETRNPVIKDANKIRQIVFSENIKVQGLPKMERVVPSLNDALFDGAGNPLLWYYKSDDGKLEFFGKPGRHQRNGVELKPVDKEAATLLDKYFSEGKYEMIVGYVSPAVLRTQAQPAEHVDPFAQPVAPPPPAQDKANALIELRNHLQELQK